MKKVDWEPDNWHGFDFSDAYPVPADDVQRMIENTIGFSLEKTAYVIAGLVPEPIGCFPDGHATLSTTGDTLILRYRGNNGFENVYDCKVRRVFHPRREGCKP